MAAIELGVSNGRVEGLTTKIRSIIARCYGLHSAEATPSFGDAFLWTN